LLVEGRLAALLQTLTTANAAALGPAEVVLMLTREGARATGWAQDAGQLIPGAVADIVGFDLSSPRLAAADPHALLSNLVFAGSTRDLKFVMIDGRVVIRDGIHLAVDTREAVRKAKEVMRKESIPASGAWCVGS
jgi:5-methylthioadenosine/S-adenosylhomocysteine deaminase